MLRYCNLDLSVAILLIGITAAAFVTTRNLSAQVNACPGGWAAPAGGLKCQGQNTCQPQWNCAAVGTCGMAGAFVLTVNRNQTGTCMAAAAPCQCKACPGGIVCAEESIWRQVNALGSCFNACPGANVFYPGGTCF